MNTLIVSLPIFILFIYGFFNIRTGNLECNKQAKIGTACFNDGSCLAKGWILAIIMFTLILSIIGL